jgi:microcystin-dependent protein
MQVFLGQIMTVGFNFAPRGWAMCEGQLLSINQYQALFSLLGTTYGGDGRTTFALPDLRGRVVVSPGRGAGLSDYRQGAKGGVENVTLNTNQIPSHNHSFRLGGSANSPAGSNSLLASVTGTDTVFNNTSGNAQLAGGTITNTGGGQSHENRMPFLAVYRIIALQGVFPSRN